METLMTNVGNVDRVLRFLIGVVLLLAVFAPQLGGLFDGWGPWKYVVAAVGAVLLATAAIGICPAYSVFGLRTYRKT
jgi:membrane protein YdbS with pleckstrin-like domain